ncbi:hypothetical protein J2T18_003810 [Paenibacillus polymyxa]|nr:hypothetical protein [Paenibacillus polymyxa]
MLEQLEGIFFTGTETADQIVARFLERYTQ